MRLSRTAPLLLSLLVGVPMLAACGDDGADLCAARHETYHLSATLSVRDPEKSAGAGEGTHAEALPVPAGKLMLSVGQDRSILSCQDGLASESYPAAPLFSTTVALQDAAFALDVPATFYPAIHVPVLWLQVRLDENGNGQCDEGELAGGAELPRDPTVNVHLELVRAACPLPTL